MIAFIDDHRAAHGVEPICRVLPIAPSTYHAHAAKHADPTELSARAQRDARCGWAGSLHAGACRGDSADAAPDRAETAAAAETWW